MKRKFAIKVSFGDRTVFYSKHSSECIESYVEKYIFWPNLLIRESHCDEYISI
jgi:hypothetical protein